ncbi:MAG: hypothetical protein U9R08_04375 [Nanoarchaeota archaeon]|nr:hypothetical protein [Nanoarchaeota archaeon]
MTKITSEAAIELLLSHDNNSNPDKTSVLLADMLERLVELGYRSSVLSFMTNDFYRSCAKEGHSGEDLQNLLQLSKKLCPNYVEPTPAYEMQKSGIYLLKQKFKDSTGEQRKYFRQLWDNTPEEKRGDLIERMAIIDCDHTLDYFLEHGPDFLGSLNDGDSAAVIDLMVDVNCNETLRLLLEYGKEHCTNGGKKLFMQLLQTYARDLRDEKSKPAEVMGYIHSEVKKG